ncbi:hypothetical protein NDU88_004421 [Pleurodeles waltl]|uniref:Uncharacterized protein n=1 Tax=Pleurodeles waltl TaxID=8319 RepID=A0AAV7NSF9_PLEWA|nr:hypothetical protein NDU88_004421 [Pleurodeles waltl]
MLVESRQWQRCGVRRYETQSDRWCGGREGSENGDPLLACGLALEARAAGGPQTAPTTSTLPAVDTRRHPANNDMWHRAWWCHA